MFDIILRSSAVYLAIIIGLRVAGKRHLGQLSIPDFVLILLISNAVQNAMVGNDSSLLGGLAAAATLIVINVIVSYFIFRNRTAKRLLEGSALLLLYNGELVQAHMHEVEISSGELLGVIREHGLQTFAQVYTAILELDGTISIVPANETKPRLSTSLMHKKAKFRRHQ